MSYLVRSAHAPRFGIRVDAGGSPPEPPPVAPVLQEASISTNGISWQLRFSETINAGIDGPSGFIAALSAGSTTLTYLSGLGTDTLTYSGSHSVPRGVAATISYTQPGSGLVDDTSIPVASFANRPVANYSVVSTGAYVPPIGIPDPALYFEGFNPIDTPVPDRTTRAPGWFLPTPQQNTKARGFAYDCYYVDSTHPSASDTVGGVYNYGTPSVPRKTVPGFTPTKMATPGAYIEIHGGPYNVVWTPYGVGTPEEPIWVVGVDLPQVAYKLDFGYANLDTANNPTKSIAYWVFDGVLAHSNPAGGGAMDIRPRYDNNRIHHLVFRHCKFHGNGTQSDATGVAVGCASAFAPTQRTDFIVLYDCEVAYFGREGGEECGVYYRAHSDHLWVLDSDIHHNAEDGFGGGAGMDCTSKYYWIGRNRIHENVTDPMDIKGIYSVIVSQNEIWGHYDIWEDWDTTNWVPTGEWVRGPQEKLVPRIVSHEDGVYSILDPISSIDPYTASPSTGKDINHISTGAGSSPVFHYGGYGSTHLKYYVSFPQQIGFIFNVVRDARNCFATDPNGLCFVIGNLMYGTRRLPSGYLADVPYGLNLGGVKQDTYILNNTIYDCEGLVFIQGGESLYSPTASYKKATTVTWAENGNKRYTCFYTGSGDYISGIPPSNTAYWVECRTKIHGNVIFQRYRPESPLTSEWRADFRIDDLNRLRSAVDMDYNLVFSPGGETYCVDGTVYNLAGVKSIATNAQQHGVAAAPDFVDINGVATRTDGGTVPNFRLRAGSPGQGAIPTSFIPTIREGYDRYEATFGVNILKDITGAPRPTDAPWDMGAFQR